jgi:Tol biopolymer transport system component
MNDSILFLTDRSLGSGPVPSVHLMHWSGSGMHSVTNQWVTFSASWSPRRWKIIYICDSGWTKPAPGLFVMNSDGTNIRRLTPLGEDVTGTSAWSPDGNWIAYVEIDPTDQYRRGRVKLIRPDGTQARILTNWYGSMWRVAWSNDSQKIVFSGFEYMNYNRLYIINTDGSGLSVLFDHPQPCYSPSWSPNGRFIAFESFARIDNIDYSNIFTYELATSHIRQITSGKTFDSNPTWSSDSRTIVFSSAPPGVPVRSSLYRIGADGANVARITDSLGIDWNPSWFN